jgi:hypothetical protein
VKEREEYVVLSGSEEHMWAHLLGSHVEEYLGMSNGSSKNEAHVVQYHLQEPTPAVPTDFNIECAFSRFNDNLAALVKSK